ncbi:carbohydrate ABC transporter permease [Dactylosporangium sp. NPDC048998]|uniref:carbohydrate ABC transporter permease n=1 Tax=Dactylosporangium sp. NPDC048998 TaxID=3363976 RepID=UPI0037127501
MSRAARRFGLALAMPSIALVLLLILVPAALTIDQSLRDVPADGSGWGEFVGLANYQRVLASPVLWRSLLLTLAFAGIFIVLSTVIGLGTALLLNESFPGRWFVRSLVVIPWACPWMIVGIIWKWFLDGSIGELNGVLLRTHLISGYSDFLASPKWALVATVLAATWRQSSMVALLFLAGLQTLPPDLHATAAVDGAGVFTRFRHITIPWLRPVLAVVTVLNIIYGLMQFDLVFTMTQGGPGDATTLMSILIYRQMFLYTNLGVGSAIATVLALVALGGGLAAVKLLYRTVEV